MTNKLYCSVCGKLIVGFTDLDDDDIQCSIECAEKSYSDNPAECYICHCNILSYYEYFNNVGKCNYCHIKQK